MTSVNLSDKHAILLIFDNNEYFVNEITMGKVLHVATGQNANADAAWVGVQSKGDNSSVPTQTIEMVDILNT